jgi:hypothetical protein
LLKGAAKALVNQFFQRLGAQVGGTPDTGEASWWRKLLRSLGLAK